MNLEKEMAKEVLFAISEDNQPKVEKCFRKYIDYCNIEGKRENMKLFEGICKDYVGYQVKKAKQNR